MARSGAALSWLTALEGGGCLEVKVWLLKVYLAVVVVVAGGDEGVTIVVVICECMR